VQVEIKSKIEAKWRAVYNFLVSSAYYRRFQRGFHQVNLHLPTMNLPATTASTSMPIIGSVRLRHPPCGSGASWHESKT
jgi:hypothetical protein